MSTPRSDASEPGTGAGTLEPDPRRWKALSVCLVAGFMTLLDVSIVNVALPSIREGLGASDAALQWIVSGYALTFGLVLVPSGRLGDARGRRTMFILGVSVFTGSSLLAGLAPSAGMLVLARLLQGLGGGILNPQVSALIQELFSGRERGRAFGLMGTVIGISTAVGPLLGGLIIRLLGEESGWRWIFFINVPIGLGLILLATRLVPRGHLRPRAESRDLDPVGVVLLGGAVLGILLPLVQGRQWATAVTGPILVTGVCLLVVFGWWERRYTRRGRVPVLDLSLFGLRSYRSGAALAWAYFAGFTGVFFVMTLFFQNGLGYTPLLAGLAMTPFALGSALGASVGGRLIHGIGRPLVVAGLVMVVTGVVVTDVLLAVRGDDPALGWWTVAPLLVAGIGSGLVISPNITLTLSDVPVRRAGTAGAALQTGQRMGTAAGVALVGALYFGTLSSSGGDYQQAAGTGLRATILLTTLALLIGVYDTWQTRRLGRSTGTGPRPAPVRRAGRGQ